MFAVTFWEDEIYCSMLLPDGEGKNAISLGEKVDMHICSRLKHAQTKTDKQMHRIRGHTLNGDNYIHHLLSVIA